MLKIFRLSVLMALLLLLPLTGCNDNSELPPTQPETPIITNPIMAETITDISELFGDIGKSYEVLINEHPNAKIIIYSTVKDEYPDTAIIIPEDTDPGGAQVSLGEPGASYAYCLFGSQDSELLRSLTDDVWNKIRCEGITTTVGALFPQISGDMPVADFFSMINVSEYEDFGEDDQDPFPGWLKFEYEDMTVFMNARISGAISGDVSQTVTTIKESYRVTLTNMDIAIQNQKYINDYIMDR